MPDPARRGDLPGEGSWFVGEPHVRTAEEVAASLGVETSRGLSADEVRARAAVSGANAVSVLSGPSPGRMLLRAATQPFVLLLLAAGLAAVALGEVRDGLLILAGLVPIVGADVLTEYRAERALAALRAASAPRATVRRDGRVLDIPAADLVPGDVVLLRVGDIVPADVRLTRCDGLAIDRSVLTGESIPETAATEADPAGAPITARRCMAYSGTAVVAGRGEGMVVATGTATEVGRIAGGLATRQRRRSPLQHELDRLVRLLLVVAVGLVAVTTGFAFARGESAGDSLLAGIVAAIAAVPEEPPVLLAVVLGLGSYRLLRRGVLVRRLNAEEVLGAVDLIITDKTGTLTQNRLAIASVTDAAGAVTDPARLRELLAAAHRAEEDAWTSAAGGVSSFTAAIVRALEDAGGRPAIDPAALVSSESPGTGRPFSRTEARRDGHVETLVIGAPEAVADLALGGDGPERSWWHERIEAVTDRGERVVGLAGRLDGGPWTMQALIGFADPLRPGIREAATTAREAGIQVVMVTGDHPTTARAIAAAAGIEGGATVVGEVLEGWSDEELRRRLPDLGIVARSTPDQKRRIVEVARGAGRLVAVTGDGVNDAPALHQADVAVAMGSGTAVAREASDLVLGDDSFATLVFGIREGRRLVDNVQKGLVFLVSTHVALLGFILMATLAGVSHPLLPIQVLWLELFIDIAASVAFEREAAEPDVMRRPPRPAGRPLLTRGILARIALAGAFTGLAALWLMIGRPGSAADAQWLAYTVLVCGQAVRAYANRSLTQPLQRLSMNGLLLGACLVVVLVQAAIPLVPGVADAFRAVPLSWPEWAVIAAVALGPLAVAQVARRGGRRVWVA